MHPSVLRCASRNVAHAFCLMAQQTNLAPDVALIALDDGAAAPPMLTQILTVNALFPSRRALVPLLDGRSLARLNACARAFGKKDEASGRSFCENVARERVLPLMRAHLAGVRSIGGENPERLNQTSHAVLRAPTLEGDDLFPPEADAPHWPHRGRTAGEASQVARACDAFAGPVAAGRRERPSVGGRAMWTCPRENRPLGDAVRAAALRARRDAISRGGALAMSPYTHARTPGTARLYLRSSKARGAALGYGTGRGNRQPPREGTAGARPSRVSGARSKRDSSLLSLSSRWSLRSRPLPDSNLKDSIDEF